MNVDPRAPTYVRVPSRGRRWLSTERRERDELRDRRSARCRRRWWQSGEGRVVVLLLRETDGPFECAVNLRATVSGNIVSLAWDAPYSGSLPSGYTLIGSGDGGWSRLADA